MSNDSINLGLTELKDKLTSLRNIVRSFELRLSGYVWDANATKFIYKGDVLAGQTVINKGVGLLQAFSEESNLLTSKDRLTIERQIYHISKAFNNTLVDDIGCTKENYNVVLTMFQDTIDNICDIIQNSKSTMDSLFKIQTEENTGSAF